MKKALQWDVGGPTHLPVGCPCWGRIRCRVHLARGQVGQAVGPCLDAVPTLTDWADPSSPPAIKEKVAALGLEATRPGQHLQEMSMRLGCAIRTPDGRPNRLPTPPAAQRLRTLIRR